GVARGAPLAGQGAARRACVGTLAVGLLELTAGQALRGETVLKQAGPLSPTAAALGAVGGIGLVVGSTGAAVLAPLRPRGPRYLGTISYGVYLYHLGCLVAAEVLARALGLPGWSFPVIALPLCLVTAVTSWELIESPILRLKDR